MKGLDNSMPESYSKLRRFLLRGQPRRCSSFFHPWRSTILCHLVPTPLSPCRSDLTFHPPCFQTRPRTSKRQFDKMQISFVSLTTIGFSASSFLVSSSFSSSSPSYEQRCTASASSNCTPSHLHFQAFAFLRVSSFFSACPCSPLVDLRSARARFSEQYPQKFTTRKTAK